MNNIFFNCSIFIFTLCISCSAQEKEIIVGAERWDVYQQKLEGKRIALMVNQTSMVRDTHLVDFLLEKKINVKKIYAVEHGFRGNVERGKFVDSNVDEKTGIPIVSTYGKTKKPSSESLADVDLVIFDIQDVGARFYTYISSLHYLMEACAENKVKLMVLDRPNPNGHYVDGPVLNPEFRSFVGMHPIPVVHGCTVGEIAKMINGEGWLENGVTCDLEIVAAQNYDRMMKYRLPIKPSPNLPNDQSINLYPSLCFFEGTPVSVGRGTEFPFQIYGYPDMEMGAFAFTPQPIEGVVAHPVHEGEVCYGKDLRQNPRLGILEIAFVLDMYKKWQRNEPFFKPFFDKLAGTDALRVQIEEGWSEEEIRKSWKNDIEAYLRIRKNYLLYP